MNTEIKLEIKLDENRVPETIVWDATERNGDGPKSCDALLLALWSHEEQAAYRIDLWTKSMPVDEMSALFVQNFLTLADTYERATGNKALSGSIRSFARQFEEESSSTSDPST